MTHYYQNVRGAFTFPKLYYSMVSMFDNEEFAEIGCDCGQSSCFIGVEIINQNKNIKLNLIDTWGDVDLNNPNGYDSYDLFRKNIQPVKDKLGDKINIIKDYSVNASKLFENESLDFIFIDACHDYECVVDDLNAWFPKLKKNGIIAGHDYYAGFYGVEKAVNEFFYENSDKLYNQEYCWLYNNKHII